MASALGRFEPWMYNALRIVAGFLFFFHGLQKFGFVGGRAVDLASRLGIAAIIETVAGPLIMTGLLTVPAAFIASGEMAFAYFTAHQPRALWPIQNGGELAALYCFIFLLVAARGPGALSLDAMMRGRRRRAS